MTTKSYSPIDPSGQYSWVEIERKSKDPKVECAKCGNTDNPKGYTIEVKKKGKGYRVYFASNLLDKFI